MYHKELYQTCTVSSLYQKQQTINSNYLRRITYTEREVMIQIIHVLLGFSGNIFCKQSQSWTYKWNHNLQPMLSHLTCETLHSALKKIIFLANQLGYITQQTNLLNKHQSFLVQQFTIGIYQFLTYLKQQYTQILYQIQQQANNIPNKQPKQSRFTIISLLKKLQLRQQIINSIIKVLKATLKSIHQQLTIFNFCVEIICQLSCYCTPNMQLIISTFMPFFISYFKLIKNLILMDQHKSNIKKGVQFFIGFDKINEKYTKQSSKNVTLSNVHSIMFDKEVQNNSKSNENMFELQNIMDRSLVPEILEKYVDQILHLEKTIQFIYMYYKQHEYQELDKYFAIEEQFKQLINYCQGWAILNKPRNPSKKINFHSISSKMRGKVNKTMQHIQHEKDNPYEMLVSTKGTFELSPLSCNETINQMDINIGNIIVTNEIKNCQFLHTLMNLFNKILQRINKKCLQFLQPQFISSQIQQNRVYNSIKNCLQGIKKFMLFQQGDFIHDFLSLVFKIFDNPEQKISRNLVSNQINQAIKSSNAYKISNDIKQHITFIYLKTKNNLDYPNYLKGWANFAIIYQPQSPTNAIFTTTIINKFASVFNFIFNIKKCQYMIHNIWKYQKSTYYSVTQSKTQIKLKIYKLRHKLTHYIHSLLNFILLKIDISWNNFQTNLLEALNIIQIISLINELLIDIHRYTLLDRIIFNSWLQLNEIVDKFKIAYNNWFQEDALILIEQLIRIQQQLDGIITMCMQIDGFKQMINFNRYMIN